MTEELLVIPEAYIKMNQYINEESKIKVFLGGTCNGSTWREKLIPLLKTEYFNPVVEDWTEECQAEERKQRRDCSICLYVITPKMSGTFSIAEVVDDSNKRPHKTILVTLKVDAGDKFTDAQWKSLNEVSRMVEQNGGRYFSSLETAADYINKVK